MLYMAAFFLLGACSSMQPAFPPQGSAPPGVRMSVFLAPATPIPVHEKKVLLLPARTPHGLDPGLSQTITKILQDALLQEKVFAVVERVDPARDLAIEERLDEAAARGFDFVMAAEFPLLLSASGNSPGRVAMDITILSTPNRISLWRMVGEADLVPLHEDYSMVSIVLPAPFIPGPSIASGVVALARSMASIIKQTAGGPVSHAVDEHR